MILLDSNILLRHASKADPSHALVKSTVNSLHAVGEVLCVVPQNFYEFWAAATRPLTANGLGLSISDCVDEIKFFKQLFRFLPDQPTLFDEWEKLVEVHACRGRISYDARLVAAMRTYGISRILTFNGSDFARFDGLTVLDPTDIVLG